MSPRERTCFASIAHAAILSFVLLVATHVTDGQIASPGNKQTPELKAYLKIVYDSIGARWYSLVEKNADWAKFGTVRIDFLIAPEGKVKNLQVLDHTGGHVAEEIARDAIEHVSLPPIPRRLMRQLHTPDLECDIKFTIFANKGG